MPTRIPTIPSAARLTLVLLLAISLRLVFFVGLVSGDPQDDGVYYGNALALFNDGPAYLEQYRNLPADFLANPIDQFNVRPLVTYPIAASFALFGIGEVPASAWALLCSVLSVFVVYRLGTVLHDRTVGLVAALLCAFYPLEVINGTRILSDVQVGLFSSLSLLMFVEATRRQSAGAYALCGVATACAYMANGRGLLIFIAITGCGIIIAVARRTRWEAPLYIGAGFLAVFGVEALVYYRATGDPLLSYHIQSGANRFKYLHEHITTSRWNWVEVRYTNGQPFELLRSVAGLDGSPTNHFGLFFYLFAASMLFSMWRRRNLLLLGVALALCAYLEFGAVRVDIDWSHRAVRYLMVYKQPRFLMMITAPLLILAAYFLREVWRTSTRAALTVLMVLLATSLTVISHTRSYYRGGLADLRTVSADIQADPDRIYWGDLWAVLHVKIFTRGHAHNLRVLDTSTTLDHVGGACMVLGGSRGVELLASYVETTLPPFAREILAAGAPPVNWQVIRTIPGHSSAMRSRDLQVLCAD